MHSNGLVDHAKPTSSKTVSNGVITQENSSINEM